MADIEEILKDLKDKTWQLGQEKAKYEALLNSLGEGIVVTDQDGNVEMINRRAEELIGWKLSEVVGKKWSEVAQLVDEKGNPVAAESRATKRVLATGIPIHSDNYFYLCKDGSKFAVATTAAPVNFEDKTVGVIAVFRDNTIERSVDRAKSEFVSLASHQLRTPLSAIKWFTEMLINGDAGEMNNEQKEYLNNVYSSNERMIELVTSLLNISRIESGRIIVSPVPTNLGKLVAEVMVELKNKLDQKKQELIISVKPDLPEINIDPKLISQVYMNLLTNAIKYTPEGGKIMVMISQKDADIISQVTDTGVGIPISDQGRIFEKFYRGSNVVKLETDGTGLGVYLAKAVVESSGGKIWFKSEEGKGTTFWFSLPLSGMEAKEGEVRLSA